MGPLSGVRIIELAGIGPGPFCAMMLADMKQPEFPVALGVLYNNPGKAYDESVHEQLTAVKEASPAGTVNEMLRKGRTWTVSEGA